MFDRIVRRLKSISEGLSRKTLLILYLFLVVGVILGFSFLYQYMMAVFEGQPVSFAHAVQVVFQTMTTTGYGGDAPYLSTQLNLLMPIIMVGGIVMIFLTLPLFVVPWLEEVVRERPPTEINQLQDHIVICGSVSAHNALIDECEERGLSYLLIEPDEDHAMKLHKEGYTVIHGDLTLTEVLEQASIREASHLVTDTDSETAASLVLAAREQAGDLRITCIADKDTSQHLLYAGADGVLSPRRLVGRSLADKLATSVNAKFDQSVQSLGDDYRVVELPVYGSSPVHGQTLVESGLWGARGAKVLGAWHRGHFIPAPDPSLRLDRETELLVAGYMDDVRELWEEKLSSRHQNEITDVMIVGYGQAGQSVDEELSQHGISTTIVDKRDKNGVDVIGSVEDTSTLEDAGLSEHDALVMTVGDDETAVFGLIIARQIAPGMEIIVRANEESNVDKLTRAGADYVLSLETVTGRMTARYVLNETIPSGTRIELLRTDLPAAVGKDLDIGEIRDRFNITVIAIYRSNELKTDIEQSIMLEEGDEIVLAGPKDQLDDFRAQFMESDS